MVLYINTAIVNGEIGSVFLNRVYLVSLKVYKSNTSLCDKILAITVKHESVIESEACLETVEVPIKGLYTNMAVISKFMGAITKVPSTSDDAVDVDEILGEMLAEYN